MPCLSPPLSQGSDPQRENRITCRLSRAVSFFFPCLPGVAFAFVEKKGEEDSGEEDSSWILTSTAWGSLLKPEKKKKRERQGKRKKEKKRKKKN